MNIDNIVNYESEYRNAVPKSSIKGTRLVGLCPFHDDTKNSFSADLKTGQFNCFACGEKGNFISFYAKIHSVTNEQAYKEIMESHNILPEKEAKQVYTVEEYALEKKIPADWLRENCALEEGQDKDGTPWIRIPYVSSEGKLPTFRKRYARGKKPRFKWRYGSAGKLLLYGEWRLEQMAQNGYVVLVEGESDTQTMWYLGFPALGIPGAAVFRPEWSAKLEGLKLFLHIEPDIGGRTFLSQMKKKLWEGGFSGEVYTWSCEQFGVKDPSELYLKYGKEETAEKIRQAVERAEPLTLDNDIPVAIEGAPLQLRQPKGWLYSEEGIFQIDEKTFGEAMICRTPIILTKRLKNITTGEEKMEVSFLRDGRFKSCIFPRSVIFQSRNIMALADLGCTITSENAKHVVRFLEALEAENIDILPQVNSTSVMGWQKDGTFLPGNSSIILDLDSSLVARSKAYEARGSLQRWVDMVAPHRERDYFRFILAASFVSPLLRILKHRIFFVYNWANSRSGKTAALKAALSAWGDPERLMVNFNATYVALERMAGLYNDLPFGIDERQLAGDKQGALEKIVYMLSSGTGKSRGAKAGGLQATQTWRTVILATGEEPIYTETSKTGVLSRVVEIYGAPFEDEKDASQMHQETLENYGQAGPLFVEKLMEAGEDEICKRYEEMLACARETSGHRDGAFVSEISVVALADCLVDELIFGADAKEALARSKKMMTYMIAAKEENEARDVNENAAQFVLDWILSNQGSFGGKGMGPCFGELDGGMAYVFPSILREALEKGGYSYRKTMQYFVECGIVEAYTGEKNVKRRFTTVRRFNGRITRMVPVSLSKLANNYSLIDELFSGKAEKVKENVVDLFKKEK